MSYPSRLELPDEIYKARKQRSRNLLRVASLGIAVRLTIVTFELCGFYFFGSMALLLDGLSTLADVVSSIILIFSIKLAERPPDQNHPFGHGRYEPLAGLQLGIFLAITGGAMLFSQVVAIASNEAAGTLDTHVWLFALAAVVLLELSFRKMKAVATQEKSEALLAEAFHFRADGCNSLFALVALGIGALFPEHSWLCDRIGALCIALFMCGMGLIAAKKNLNQILDRIPEKEVFTKVERIAKSVEGVRGTEKIRIQLCGPDAHVDIDVEVDPDLAVVEAHEISQRVRYEIQKAWPQVQEVMVHIEPYYENDH
ncbi:MAG: cation transporter [Verrucomicrobia bacterium]|nr:cation transporter [Verrucomicrobiota bacterium]